MRHGYHYGEERAHDQCRNKKHRDVDQLHLATLADIEAACNHPEVLAHAAPGWARADVSRFYARPNLAYGDARGVIILGASELPGVYEWHYALGPEVRGAAALRLSRAIIHDVFTWRSGRAIYGAVPRASRAVRLMGRTLGFRPVGALALPTGQDSILYLLENPSCPSVGRFLVQDLVSQAA